MTRKIIETNEVIVRSSLLKSSPFESSSSLAVFTKKDIEEQNFDHFQNAIDQIPNLNFSEERAVQDIFKLEVSVREVNISVKAPKSFSRI